MAASARSTSRSCASPGAGGSSVDQTRGVGRRYTASGSGPTERPMRCAHRAIVPSSAWPPARTMRLGWCIDAASPMPLTARAERLSTLTPARRQRGLKRSDVRGVEIELVPRSVGQHDGYAASRWWGQALASAQPLSRPARGERPGSRLDSATVHDRLEGRQQDLLDGALDGAERERCFHCAIRALAVVGHQGPDHRIGVCGERAASARHGRRD